MGPVLELRRCRDVDLSGRNDRGILRWDAGGGKHVYVELDLASITGLQAALESLASQLEHVVVANPEIPAGTGIRISYDSNGLVTGHSDATTAEISDSLNRRYVTDALWAVLSQTSGANTGDQDLSGLAPIEHDHTINEITDLTSTLAVKADLIDGKLPTSQLPALAIVEFLGSVASESEMLELDGQRGDWCIRSDVQLAFFLIADDASELESWQQITTPASPVLSVNDQTGAIVLGYADVGAAPLVHGHAISDVTNLQSSLDGKAALSHTHTVSQISDMPTISQTSLANALVRAGSGGTIADNFLSSNVPWLNVANTFSANQTVNGYLNISGGLNVGHTAAAPANGVIRLAQSGASEPVLTFGINGGSTQVGQIRGVTTGGLRFTDSGGTDWLRVTPGQLTAAGNMSLSGRAFLGGGVDPITDSATLVIGQATGNAWNLCLLGTSTYRIISTNATSGAGPDRLSITVNSTASVASIFTIYNGMIGLGAGNYTPTAVLDVLGNTFRLRTARTPASATATGNQGDICWDSGYLYVCVATNTWKRASLSSW